MRRLLIPILLAGALGAQTPVPEIKDPLGRDTPHDTALHFLEACHARDYSKALRFLDLNRMSADDRAKKGPQLARELEDLLDDTPFDISTLSTDPEGDQTDGLAPEFERLHTFHLNGQDLEIQLERKELKRGLHVWLVSAASIDIIPKAHQLVGETALEKKLPQFLVTFEILDTPVWRWIALLGMAIVFWIAARFVVWALIAVVRPLVDAPGLRGPLRICLTVAAFRAAMDFASPSTLPRLFIERALTMILALALAWTIGVMVDLFSERWHSHLDPRVQSIRFSVLPLGRQILKLALFLAAILGVLSAWGYNTTTILAGVGVGGLAIALAAQKTLENLFGGVSVIGDRPVLVGDLCRFGDRIGTVMHIGLRSTRIRTPERTIISVPNAQFSQVPLENISARDKIWFHHTLNLRRDTTSDQLLQVLSGISAVLTGHAKVEAGPLPVRFIGVGAYSLDVEVIAYVLTSDFEEFLGLQQELLLKMLQAVEHAGTALAVPLQESVARQPAPQA